ncbi:hypothetical protein [Bombella apis]|uniref:hypothetical protein n=1 Tax=Bombella apis TaxID=1785988 RepID=UPI0024A90F62|nr:hypothetical protein [Bombella apis]
MSEAVLLVLAGAFGAGLCIALAVLPLLVWLHRLSLRLQQQGADINQMRITMNQISSILMRSCGHEP